MNTLNTISTIGKIILGVSTGTLEQMNINHKPQKIVYGNYIVYPVQGAIGIKNKKAM